MSVRIVEVVTLRAYNISSKGKLVFVGELLALAAILYVLLATSFLVDIPFARKLAWLAAVYIGARAFFGAIRIPLISTYRSRMRLGREDRDNFIIGINSLMGVLSLVAVVVGIFAVFGIEVRLFLTSLGLFSVAIVWVGSDYIKNFIDSFVLMFSRDFKLGEYIRIDQNIKGVIQDITFRATKIKTDEGDILFVPNSKILHSEVINYSKARFKRITVPFSMFRNRLQHLASFEEKLKTELAGAFPGLVNREKVYLRVRDISGSEAHLALEVSVTTYNFDIEERIRKWISGYVLAEDEKL